MKHTISLTLLGFLVGCFLICLVGELCGCGSSLQEVNVTSGGTKTNEITVKEFNIGDCEYVKIDDDYSRSRSYLHKGDCKNYKGHRNEN
jgi:hypothetical protein